MRLMIIILVGAIAIGATYFFTRTADQQDSPTDLAVTQTIKANTHLAKTGIPGAPAVLGTSIDKNSAATSPTDILAESSRIPATSKDQARQTARAAAGDGYTKKDPFMPIAGSGMHADANTGSAKTSIHNFSHSSSHTNMLVPPPPPGAFPPHGAPGVIDTLPSGLAVDQLPTPPSSQLVSTKIRLTGIMQDRAFFTVTDRIAARANQWPAEFVLRVGQGFHGMHLQSIDSDGHRVVVAEGGELHTCVMPAIK